MRSENNGLQTNSSLRTLEGNQTAFFYVKYDPVSLELLFCAMYYCASFSFVFQDSGSWSKLLSVALNI